MTPYRNILKAIFDNMKMFASAITIYNCNTHVEHLCLNYYDSDCYELLLSICVCIIWILDPCLWQDCPRKLVMETITLNLFNHYLYIAVSTHYVYIAIAVHSVQHIHLLFSHTDDEGMDIALIKLSQSGLLSTIYVYST